MLSRIVPSWLLCFTVISSGWATPQTRTQGVCHDEILTGDWRFRASNDLIGCEGQDYDDRVWSVVQVPHCIQTLAKQIDYSHAWYRKRFYIPDGDADKRIYLKCDAAGITAFVYVNGQFVGHHVGAYTAFVFDITEVVKFGAANQLAIRCDSKQNIVGNLSRPLNKPCAYWNVAGGLHRLVHLLKRDVCHIDPTHYASTGVYVTPEILRGRANVNMETRLRNSSDRTQIFEITHRLYDPAGGGGNTWTETVKVAAQTRLAHALVGVVQKPQLWSPKNPVLHTLHTELRVQDQLVDAVRTRFGFRHFAKNANGQFELNGERIRLIGASLHSRTEKGFHVYTSADARKDLKGMKEAGFNTVFYSHYPFPKFAYDLADEMGLLVWAENGYVRGSYDPEVSQRITEEMVYQNWNHPSIYCWSVGNELEKKMDYAVNHLAQVVKDIGDPQRLIAYNPERANLFDPPACNLISRSHFPAWYGSHGKTPFEATFPYINQHGAGGHYAMQRSYINPNRRVDHWEPAAFQQVIAEAKCQQIYREGMHELYYWWQYKDQECPKLRRLINSKGLITLAGTPKDSYYLFKTFGRPEMPQVHICGKQWFLRQVNELKAYSNAQALVLTINGQSRESLNNGAYRIQGRRIDNVFLWADVLVPGRNEIEVCHGDTVDRAVIYFQSTPNEAGAPIRDLEAGVGPAYFINAPVRDQFPFHATFDGTAINTFDIIPEWVKGAGWIATKRQDKAENRTDLSFTAQADIEVFVMSDLESDRAPAWLSNAGLRETGIRGQWRGDDLILQDFVLYQCRYSRGQRVKLKTGKNKANYVVLIRGKK